MLYLIASERFAKFSPGSSFLLIARDISGNEKVNREKVALDAGCEKGRETRGGRFQPRVSVLSLLLRGDGELTRRRDVEKETGEKEREREREKCCHSDSKR